MWLQWLTLNSDLKMKKERTSLKRGTCLFVDVPVQAVVLEDKPVLLPFLGKVTLRVSLSPQPALAVSSAQSLAGNTPPTQGGQTASWNMTEET